MNILDILARSGMEFVPQQAGAYPAGEVEVPRKHPLKTLYKSLLEMIAMPEAAGEIASGQRTVSDIPREYIDRSDPNYQPSIFAAERPITEILGIDEGDFMLPGMVKVFHGSPHKFTKFSMDKIGTGEGAQAFGHGLYFTSQKEVAKHYANRLGAANRKIFLGRNEFTPRHQSTKNFLIQNRGDVKAAIDDAYDQAERATHISFAEDYYDAADELKEILKTRKKIKIKDDANLYKAKLWEGKDEVLLDWDKPVDIKQLSKIDKATHDPNIKKVINEFKKDIGFKLIPNNKSKYAIPEVKKAVNEATKLAEGYESAGIDIHLVIANDGDVYRAITKKFPELIEADDWAEEVLMSVYGATTLKGKPTGEQLYRRIADELSYSNRAKTGKYDIDPQKETTSLLNKAGIDGIRYPAGTLSGGGKGYNYVVFDEEAIKMEDSFDNLVKKAKDNL